jgi:DNA-binding NarL/FixJ family response regulator
MKVKIGIADDQQLFVKSLGELIGRFKRFETVVDGLNGKDLLDRLAKLAELPDIVLLDVNMPTMDGVSTAKIMTEKYPDIKIVALSTNDDDATIINMLRAGSCAYLLKDIHPDELERALEEIYEKGFYNADVVNIRHRRLILHEHAVEDVKLNDREILFLKLACSDLTYKQIASEMNLAPRTIDGYREALFEKFNVQSRVGMAMEAIRRQLIKI